MRPISDHLHHRRFAVAVTDDPARPLRQWRHSTVWAVSHLSAVYEATAYRESVVGERMIPGGVGLVHEMSDGRFVRATF